MGVKIFDLVECDTVTLQNLKGKIIAADASLFLHQFITSIRQPDGMPLTNSKGKVTSHLVGLFSRTARLVEHGMKLCYVFDGTPPKLKQEEIKRRSELKEKAQQQYEEAKEQGDVDAMRKYSARTVRLTPEMVAEAKELLDAMGIPVVQAPSEAEAQAAYLTKTGAVWAVASQDADTLLFGAKRLIRNLAIAGRRKRAGGLTTQIVRPELIHLETVRNKLNLTQEQLIIIAMLIGTDFNPKGIPRIGQKKALKLIQQFGSDFDALFKEVAWDAHWKRPWQDVFEVFTKIPVEDATLSWKSPNETKIKDLLVKRFEFTESRVDSTLKLLSKEPSAQKGLFDFA